MDSLLAYASSSDDEADDPQPQPLHKPTSSSSSLFSSLPKPTSSSPSSSLFSSLPKPAFQKEPTPDASNPPPSSSIFSKLPPPKSQVTLDSPLLPPHPKRIVQFRPPQISISSHGAHDNDDEEDKQLEKDKPKPNTLLGPGTNVMSFLSTIPAPKNSGSSSLGGGSSGARRSVIETLPVVPVAPAVSTEPVVVGSSEENSDDYVSGTDGSQLYNYDVGYEHYAVAGSSEYGGGGYQSYDHQQSYDSSSYSDTNWSSEGGSSVSMPGSSGFGDGAGGFVGMGGGKRRRDQLPDEIVEVKQDELLKNRPTEDKSKLTGMAFGPSYQPASSKGKPSKVHKRKHQIGSLYFDMRQKEMELAERRAKGFLTKAETQAKYGW